ncbi:hypothetical protein CFOL_v3_26996, partial [Cephalotus follicularis]
VRMNGTEKLKEVITNGRWSWPQTSWQLIEIQQRVQDIPVSSQSDCIWWHKKGGAFSTKQAWHLIRRASDVVPWCKMVWFSKRIPKHSYDHLFFDCPYSRDIWRDALRRCNIFKNILPWVEQVQWLEAFARRNNFPTVLMRLALGATVYHIWLERKRRCFRNLFLPGDELCERIREDVGRKIKSTGYAYGYDNDQHHSLCINWGVL